MSEGNPTSSWVAADYAAHGGFVADHADVILDVLDPRPGERILDLGCGDGRLTARIAEAGATVLGVDASRELVSAARAAGVHAILGDGEHLTFTDEFDAVFSNAALHWMLDATSVAAGVLRALRPGGRFVAEFGGVGNIAAIRVALAAAMERRGYAATDPGQYYPTADAYGALLARVGFTDVRTSLVPRPTELPGSMAEWLRTFRRGYLDAAGVPPDVQVEVIDDTVARLEPVLLTEDGVWIADYVRLRFRARRPADR